MPPFQIPHYHPSFKNRIQSLATINKITYPMNHNANPDEIVNCFVRGVFSRLEANIMGLLSASYNKISAATGKRLSRRKTWPGSEAGPPSRIVFNTPVPLFIPVNKWAGRSHIFRTVMSLEVFTAPGSSREDKDGNVFAETLPLPQSVFPRD